MAELIALASLPALLTGIALGWYLRRINSWCPRCGDTLACAGCGRRPTWFSPGRIDRPLQ